MHAVFTHLKVEVQHATLGLDFERLKDLGASRNGDGDVQGEETLPALWCACEDVTPCGHNVVNDVLDRCDGLFLHIGGAVDFRQLRDELDIVHVRLCVELVSRVESQVVGEVALVAQSHIDDAHGVACTA